MIVSCLQILNTTCMAFYLKYRPQQLSDLVGQEAISENLFKAFTNKKLSHAYLFCGPRGSGKTSTARILAKMVNCLGGSSDTIPCNTCSSCMAVNNGSFLDLIEIDAASNRGIDDIRSLRENIKLSPSIGQKKVYIIDEVHMLTTEAFNALLKTLEEPPSHVIFILATTESHKIPQTILSRVQRFDFNLASIDDLSKLIRKVAIAESLEIDDTSVNLIASKADGAYRDALKILDQLASQSHAINQEMVETLLRSGSVEETMIFLQSLHTKNSLSALQSIQLLLNHGTNIKDFTTRIIETLRLMLLSKQGVAVSLNSEIAELTKEFSVLEIVRSIELLTESLSKLKYSTIISLPLEIAVVQITNDLNLEKTEKKSADNILETVSSKKTEPLSDEENIVVVKNTSDDIVQISEPTKKEKVGTDDILTLREKWNYILETIRPYNFSLEALLKQSKLVRCDDGTLVLEVPYSFHQRILEAPKSRGLMESVVSDVLGKTIKVTCTLGKRPVRVEELANVEIAADDEMVRLASEIFNS